MACSVQNLKQKINLAKWWHPANFGSLALINYQPPAHLKFPKSVFLLLFQPQKKDLLLPFQSFEQEGKDYIFQEQMGDIFLQQAIQSSHEVVVWAHGSSISLFLHLWDLGGKFFATHWTSPRLRAYVGRTRGCVCLHKIRRMVVGVLTFAHGANFCFGLFAWACILYIVLYM